MNSKRIPETIIVLCEQVSNGLAFGCVGVFFMKYADQLKHPKWQQKRLEVLSRDNFTCKACGNKEQTLHVHHFKYQSGKKAWEYPNSNFITLCADCHEEEESFISGQNIGFIKLSRYGNFPIRKMWHIAYVFVFLYYFDTKRYKRLIKILEEGVTKSMPAYEAFSEDYK